MSEVLKEYLEKGYTLAGLSKIVLYENAAHIHIPKDIRDKFNERKVYIFEKAGVYIIVSDD